MDAPADQDGRTERRRTPRFDAAVLGPVSVRLLGGTTVELINFSEDGLLFLSETRLLVGARASVRIVRGSETVIAAGTVVRSLVQGMVSGVLQFQTAVALTSPLPLATALAAPEALRVAPPAAVEAGPAGEPMTNGPAGEAPATLTPLSVCFVSGTSARAAAIRDRLAAHVDVVVDVTLSADVADVRQYSAARDLILVDGGLGLPALGDLLTGLRAAPLGASIALLVPDADCLPSGVTALANACVVEDQPADLLAEALRDAAWTPWLPVSIETARGDGGDEGLFGALPAAAARQSVSQVPRPRHETTNPDDRDLVSALAALRDRVVALERELAAAQDRQLEADAEAAALSERSTASMAMVRALTSERNAAVARALQLMRERDDALDRENAERQRADALAHQRAAAAPEVPASAGRRSRRILEDDTTDLPAPRLQRLLLETRAELEHERELRKDLETQLDENAEALERTVQAYEARLDLSSR